MTLREITTAIRDTLLDNKNLPVVSLTPRHPDNVPSLPYLSLALDSVSRDHSQSDLKRINASVTRAQFTVLVFVGTADEHLVLELSDMIEEVIGTVRGLTISSNDAAYYVGSVSTQFHENARWAAANITVMVEGYE